MELQQAFGLALKKYRQQAGMPQEGFALVSSRTYVSSLERGLKSPTLEKVQELAAAMAVHPLSLIATTYLTMDPTLSVDDLLAKIKAEVIAL